MERVLRKKRSELILSGVGAILLGIWAFIKVILNILFAADYVQRTFDFDSYDPEVKTATLFLWILLGFAGMLLYLYVGICAVREGRTGKRQRYLTLAAVLLAGNIFLLVSCLLAFLEPRAEVLDLIDEMLQEVVRAANCGAMLYAACQTRKLSQNSEREAVCHAD